MIARRLPMLLFLGLLAPAVQAADSAEAFPYRPIRMVIPFAPGGATDIIARMLGPKLAERLGQQVVIDNRAGAAGNIAVEIVATAPPDGYTLLVGNISTNSINPILFAKRMKVDAIRDLTGVTKLVAIPNFILGSPLLPAKTLKDAIAHIRQHPGKYNYQAPLGSYSHLDMLAFSAAAGLKMTHLPSKGAGETLAALLRGDIHLTESNVASNIGAVRAGQIRAFAVTSDKRLDELPEVPTMADAGFAGIGSLNWNGIFAPAKTPKPVVDKLFATIVASMKDAEMQPLLTKRLIPMELNSSPEEFNRYVRSESARWDKIIKDNSVRID